MQRIKNFNVNTDLPIIASIQAGPASCNFNVGWPASHSSVGATAGGGERTRTAE
ncbi:MAG: hypothetical protein KAJ66_06055 [Candidatus Omnitrophica bacterium]|nr:hypothetical protein [Candidatus Omnitrophota bacterium]